MRCMEGGREGEGGGGRGRGACVHTYMCGHCVCVYHLPGCHGDSTDRVCAQQEHFVSSRPHHNTVLAGKLANSHLQEWPQDNYMTVTRPSHDCHMQVRWPHHSLWSTSACLESLVGTTVVHCPSTSHIQHLREGRGGEGREGRGGEGRRGEGRGGRQ